MDGSERQALAEQMEGMLRGYFVAQALFVAARLGVADLLAKGEMGAEDLALATGVDADALHRMMRALASEGVFEEKSVAGEARFGLTEMGRLLRSDVEGSMRPAALIAGETQYKVWAVFKDVVKHGCGTGEGSKAAGGGGGGGGGGFERIFRKPLFAFLGEHPDIYAVFNAAMTQRVGAMREELLGVVEVGERETVVDIGGGMGSVVVGLLEKFSGARGVLFDTPAVIEQAREVLKKAVVGSGGGEGVRGRLTLVAGDFLGEGAVPPGDVMIVAAVLHMVADGAAVHILRNCRASLARGGRLYIAETLLRGANEKDPAKWQDLNMMMMTGGRERTFEEYAGLLREAEFTRVERRGGIILTYRE